MIRAAVLAMALLGGGPALAADIRNVTIPGDGVELRARLALPAGPTIAPAIVALHGCGGPYPKRDRQWRDLLTEAGHPVMFPDSFGSRGLKGQCTNPSRAVTPGRERRADTVASVNWLLQQDFTPRGGVVVLGWSNGGSTVLAAAAQGVMPAGAVRALIAFYPGCRIYAQKPDWAPSAPLLILMGADDDWTPAAPCRELAAKFPDRIKLITYPGAYHDFDVPDTPIRERTGLAFTAGRNGVAHAGTNPEARDAAIREVMEYLAGL